MTKNLKIFLQRETKETEKNPLELEKVFLG